MIALVDYGAGNLTSVRKALSTLGAAFTTPTTPAAVAGATGIIVPGVGHFGATRALDEAWRSEIRAAAERGAALLGICLGMQWLFQGSSEAPELSGLGIFQGNCVHLRDATSQKTKFDPTPFIPASLSAFRDQLSAEGRKPLAESGPEFFRMQVNSGLKIPHVGWNSLEGRLDGTLMRGVAPGDQVYFTHSYVAPVVAETVAETTYGTPFSAVVERGRVAGVQFHPEKSGDVGLRILRNWIELCD